MKINITQQHIDRGEVKEFAMDGFGKRKAGSVTGCAAAIAINEQIPTCEAKVIGKVVILHSLLDGRNHAVKLPKPARLFVMAFDIFHQCGHIAPQLKPLSFELDVPAELLSMEPRRPECQLCPELREIVTTEKS